MSPERLRQALTNLLLPKYRAIRNVFGLVLEERGKRAEPDCTLLDMLADRTPGLDIGNQYCSAYVGQIGPEDAARKCAVDLIGPARESNRANFDDAAGDFWAEIAAVKELVKQGYHSFRAVQPSGEGKTYDYEAAWGTRRGDGRGGVGGLWGEPLW